MPVPTDEASSIDATVSLPETFDNNHCNAVFNENNYEPPGGIAQDGYQMPLEVYFIHVNSGDSFQVSQADGSMQNLTGPTTVQLFAPNGVPPPIIAPPGYMLQYTDEGGGGGKHIRILPLSPILEPQNTYVSSPSVPHHHQPPMPMHALHHAHVHHSVFPANMVPGYRPDGAYFQPPLIYSESPGGCCYRGQPQYMPVDTTVASHLCPNAPYSSPMSSPRGCDSEMYPDVRVTALCEGLNEVPPLPQPIILHVCTCRGCKNSFLNSRTSSQFSLASLKEHYQDSGNDSQAMSTRDLAASASEAAFSEISDSSLNSMQHSQTATASESQMSSGHSGMLEPNEWTRGGAEHLHLQQSVPSDSPTRTSSSMASSSPSASSMTSSPRNSPNPFHSNGRKGSRSPLRQSPGSKPYRPAGQLQGMVPLVSGLTPNTMHPQVNDDPSASDGSLSITEESDQTSNEQRLLENLMEILRTVPKPEVVDTSTRSARITWSSLSLDGSGPEVKEKVEVCGIAYDLHLSESKKGGKYESVYQDSKREYSVKNLRPGIEYAVRLYAICDQTKGPSSQVTTFRTVSTPPDAPAPPKLQKASKEFLHLKWMPSHDNGERISKYYLEFDDATKPTSFRLAYSGPNKNFKVTKLVPSHPYHFRLAAENKMGKGTWSSVVTFHTSGIPPPIPQPPQLKLASIDSLSLYWSKPINDVTDFTLEMNDERTGYGFMVKYNGPEMAYTVKNLTRMTDYKFRLKARNNFGTSNYSQVVIHGTHPDKPQPPGKPRVKGTVHSRTVTLTWDPPRDDGGAEVVAYKIEKAKNDKSFSMVYEGVNKECTAKDLEPGQVYQFRVISMTRNDTSVPSGVLNVTTRPVLPGPCDPPSLALRPKPNCITIKWDIPSYTGGADIVSYEVNYRSEENVDEEPSTGYAGTKAECTIGDLSPGSKYSFSVRAANEVGFGSWSNRTEIITAPGQPSKPDVPEATVLSPNSIQLHWKPPSSNGADITKYLLQWGAAETSLTNYSTRGPVLSYDFITLSPNTSYFYSIQAINSVGTSPASDAGSATTLPSFPDRVSNLRLRTDAIDGTPVTAHRISVTWDAARDNGLDILSYEVHVSADATPDGSIAPPSMTHSVEANVRTFDAVELLPDTDYKLKVCATNEIGVGPSSSSLVIHTKPLPPDAPDLSCIQYGYNCLKLKWNAGSKVVSGTQYLLQKISKKESGKKLHTIYRGSDNTFVVNGLIEQTDYGFRVCAINSEGSGPFTTQYFKTKIQSPAAMKSPAVKNVKATECHVTWQKCNKIKGDSIFYRLILESHGKVIFEKELDDTKYLLGCLTPNTTYQMSIAAVRRLSSKEINSSPEGSVSSYDGEEMKERSTEVSAPASPFVAFHTQSGSSAGDGVPTLTPLVVTIPEIVKEISGESSTSADLHPKESEEPSLTEKLQKSVSKFLYDDENVTYRQMLIFYACAIIFAFLLSFLYI